MSDYELRPNAWASAIAPSATLAISSRAKALRAEGHQVLNFSAGEPDFRPPQAVTEAVRAALAERPVGYAPVPGLPDLRQLAAAELSAYHGVEFTSDQILVSCGAKHSLANLFMVTLEPGDEVVFGAPYWVSYPEMVRMARGVARPISTRAEDRFAIDPDALAEVVGPKTKFLLINSPGNPTGVGLPAEKFAALGEVLMAKAPQAWIVVDDIYRKLTYGSFEHASAFKTLAGKTDRIIVVDGLSKSHAMTGYRIGFTAGPTAIINAAKAVQGQSTSGASTPAQWAAVAAMDAEACADDLETMRETFARRRDLMLSGLSEIPGVKTVEPDGAFYVFPDFSAHIGPEGRTTDLELAKWLLEEKHVAAVPGSAFGTPGHLRLSFATDDESIREGLSRIKAALG